MTNQQWKLLFKRNLQTAILTLSPFLPGPSFLSIPTNIIFSLIQAASLFGLILIPFGLVETIKQAKKKEYKTTPILLWTIPTIAFILSSWGAHMARDLSRSLAIKNAESLIHAIEKYKRSTNTYPANLDVLKPKYINSIPWPWIMGISGYYYEKKPDNYNLEFSQNVVLGFNWEVVVYDPKDKHRAEGEMQTLYNTGSDKWKYYVYD